MATKRPAAEKAEDQVPAQSTPEQEETLREIDQITRAAYTAYGDRMQYKDYSQMSLPLFDELNAVQKSAWESVVRVVYGALP